MCGERHTFDSLPHCFFVSNAILLFSFPQISQIPNGGHRIHISLMDDTGDIDGDVLTALVDEAKDIRQSFIFLESLVFNIAGDSISRLQQTTFASTLKKTIDDAWTKAETLSNSESTEINAELADEFSNALYYNPESLDEEVLSDTQLQSLAAWDAKFVLPEQFSDWNPSSDDKNTSETKNVAISIKRPHNVEDFDGHFPIYCVDQIKAQQPMYYEDIVSESDESNENDDQDERDKE